ncbi:hypothetical protein AAW14_20365 [Streptomyces hygroscopicus]|uniref:hypothetical protein n=1 Tax=Streptomyces hygroscopicus TaxID=1912 RepID=UPI00223F0410|nr:hypothetical protein [Streptomyces hygroscopicus]MCW7944317.1 hypothetical protein [Streptomyces hygroscopicus]
MACPTGNPVTDVVVGFFSFLGDPIGTIIKGIANAMLSAAISVFGDLATNIPTLVAGGAARDISTQTQWIVVYTAVGSLLFAAARMALERRGEPGTVALKGLLRVVLVAGGATAVMTALASLSDRYADHLFQAGAQKQLTSIGCSDGTGLEGFLLLILAFLLLIAAIMQTILLYIRLGVMIILLGTLPVAAAASMTEWGSTWWRKHIGWMFAWLLYKPSAGLVMFAGSAMINSGPQSGIHEKIAGIGVMLLSALALPALLKLVSPTPELDGDIGQRGTEVATGAVKNVAASGAKSIAGGMMSAPGAGGRSGPSGASGAVGAAGAPGSAGGAGRAEGAGSAGQSAGGGASAGQGGNAPSGAAGARSAAAGGPAGMVIGAAAQTARAAGQNAANAVDGPNGGQR